MEVIHEWRYERVGNASEHKILWWKAGIARELQNKGQIFLFIFFQKAKEQTLLSSHLPTITAILKFFFGI